MLVVLFRLWKVCSQFMEFQTRFEQIMDLHLTAKTLKPLQTELASKFKRLLLSGLKPMAKLKLS